MKNIKSNKRKREGKNVENERKKAYAEVDEILSYMEDKYVEKIPKEMIDIFKKEKLQEYTPKINPQLPLEKQNLQRKTLIILAMLNLNYWCEDEKEKQKLIEIYTENDKKKEKELREKYNPDNIFKKKATDSKIENKEIIEYKQENFFKKILTRIMKLFKK